MELPARFHRQCPRSYSGQVCAHSRHSIASAASLRLRGQKKRPTPLDSSQVDSRAECKSERDQYPKYEDSKDDEDLLPKRQPGSFPNVNGERQASSNGSHSAEVPVESAIDADAAAEYDPLRDGPLRYLGYANEVGEAFGAWLPVWGVPFSYAVAITYVLTDTADKGTKAYKTANEQLSNNKKLSPEVNVPRLVKLLSFERTLDTVIWQLLASVACPGYTIHTVVALFHAALAPVEETAQAQQFAASAATSLHLPAADVMTIMDKSLPTAVGLAVIPFIVHPIDNAIHALLNASLRPAMRKYVCRPGQGNLAQLDTCADEECTPQ